MPQVFVKLDAMPLLPNGKIDRKTLPTPQASDRSTDEAFVAPRSATEQLLAKLWQDVLAIGRISVHDDFFALGGHSLLASQVIARLLRDHEVEVTFRKMFEAPTIEKLAAAIDAQGVGSAPPPAAGIARRSSSGPAPCSISQRRMWLLEEMDPATRLVHNLCASWRIEGNLDVRTLRSTLDEITRRHESLRTNIRGDGSEPVQVVHADRPIPLRSVDLTHLPEAERMAAMTADRDAEAVAPFDLATDVLVRRTLYVLGDRVHMLSTVQHNIIWDGWSFDLFLKEVSALYEANVQGRPSPLDALPVAYGDYSTWQREWVKSPEFEKQAAFWRERLSGAKHPLEIPTDRPRRGSRSHAGSSEGIHIPLARVEGLTALAREQGATLFMVVFAAYSVLLHRQTGQRDLLVGTPVRARTRPELEGLIGPFVNAVALTATVAPTMTFLELLAHVRDVTLDAFSNQEVPLDMLGDRPPMLRALFSLQDARSRPTGFGDLRVTQDHALAPVAANEIMLWAMETRADMLLMLNFSTDIFDASTARRFLHEMETLLEQIVANPRQPIGTMALLPADERETIRQASGETTASTLASVAGLRSGDVAVLYTSGAESSARPAAIERVAGGLQLVEVGPGQDARGTIASSGAVAVIASAADWKALGATAARTAFVVGAPTKALVDGLTETGADVFALHDAGPALDRPAGIERLARGETRRLLGRPLAGTRWRVVDDQGELAAVGVTGHLVVEASGVVHRTGDRVRLLADGSFEHMGRSDGRVELGGRWVDPAEIARAIQSHPAVREVVVDLCNDASGEPRLVAYFAAREAASFTETELRASARAAVGDHATPRLFVELDALPRDAVGEIVRTRLPSPYAVADVHEYVAPRTEAETYMVTVWKEALGVARIGVYDKFFDLGGHSLLCFRVIARIQSERGQRISPRLFLLDTLEQAAAQLAPAAPEGVSGVRAAAVPVPQPPADNSLAGRLRDRLKGLVGR